jgi:carboxypeptidase Taq
MPAACTRRCAGRARPRRASREGDTSAATGWLRENLQRHGGLREPRETIRAATGREPTVGPLLAYLEAKFGELYGL